MRSIGYQLVAFIFLFTFNTHAQGTIKGVVKNQSGEPIPNTFILVDSTKKALTDFDGNFSLKLPAGTYIISASNQTEGYFDQSQEVTLTNGSEVSIEFYLSKDKAVEVAGVKVTAVKTEGSILTEKAADAAREKDPAQVEILDKNTMNNRGYVNVAQAVQSIPGGSVQDDKNVFIRGLGDRYTKTQLNSMDIPGLDPDRNAVQLDIFPAVAVDNITVYKTFTPNLTADFTGGLVNVQTKDLPTKKTFYARGNFGYNSRATFNSDFISYQGGKLDFLGFDDGTRALPLSPTAKIPNIAADDPLTTQYTRAFEKTMATKPAFSFLNQNYSLVYGNMHRLNKKDSTSQKAYGYTALLNYRTNNNYFKDVQYNEYLKDLDTTVTTLFKDRASKGELATKDVMWTAMFGQSFRINSSNKISLTLFRTQNATSSAANLTERNFDSNQATLIKHGLQYTQRSISNLNLNGLHLFGFDTTGADPKWKLNWYLTPTYSRISDPDIRSTAMELSDTPGPNGEPVYKFEEAVGAEIRRIFRDLREYNVSAKIDLEYKYKQKDSSESRVAFGVLNTYKNRQFDVNEYIFRWKGVNTVVPDDPNYFFQPENIWTPEKDSGLYAVGQQEKANLYHANQNISAAYVMHVLPIKKLELTYGARVEKNVNRYTGQSSNADTDPNAPRYVNQVVLDNLNVLPSLNMVYKIHQEEDSLHKERKTNFRGSYTQTVARPSFREISISQIYDPIQGRRYLGNINLKQTLIHNADLRWEYFFGKTELISASAFYKRFINPIEIAANVGAPNEFLPVNAGTADVYGAEFEFRKSLIRSDSSKHKLVLGANFTYVVSKIDMRKIETTIGTTTMTEKEVRQANARTGETIGNFRPMYGQAPYIINAFLTYNNDSLGMMVNVSYNVEGPKLAVIGVGLTPDVYEQPFHSMNLKISKNFGKIHKELKEETPRWQAYVRAQNLLGYARRKYYESYNAYSAKDFDKNGVAKDGSGVTVPYFSFLNQGRTFSIALVYSIR